ncbi:TolC family protein [Polyangium aurulentum]|uniref:TolC family protein n=1 Tax=Polyangium aurulentum TaxID=2567896 RepID=UPI0010AEC439|nr:TolC family protein [Polyangium aurulentum]UQA63112.1 TolC family protein [Polyangium aurulentum]
MNSLRKSYVFLGVLACVASAKVPPAHAAAPQEAGAKADPSVRQISEADVISLSIRNNPDLASAWLTEKQAGYAVRAEEARYPFVLAANAGYTHSSQPSLARDSSGGTSVVVGTRDSFVIGSSLSKDFSTGTSVSLSVQGERSTTSRAVGPLVTAGAAGTGYSLSTRLSLVQPILRGAGTRIGLAGLRAAELDLNAQRQGRERVASEVVRDALTSYWELWYASQALGIEQSARAFAIAQRNDADARRAQGALSPADVLAFDTRVASLDEQVTSAELTELQRGLELAQVLGVDASASHWRATGNPAEQSVPSVAEVERKLREQSPELEELQARLAAAEQRAQVAGDAYRPRLDLEGYVELRGLGSGSPAPAFAQVGTLGAPGAYVGLVFEAPLNGGREQTEVETARVNVQLARNQLDAARSRIRLAAARLVAQVEAAKARRTAAEQTVAIAERQLEAERARFALGASTPIQVQQAEDSVRTARLRVARAKVDQVQAALALEHSVGDLAARHPAPAPSK